MPNDLVSIIIPTYNRAYCIRQTLNSVVAQTHGNWEALVVDDGSRDHTMCLIAEEYAHEPRIRYIHQQNRGVSHARNTGIRQSSGAYVAFLDSDDTWEPWKLELQLVCLNTFPDLGMVWTDMTAVDTNGMVTDLRHLQTMYSAYQFFDTETHFDKSILLGDLSQAVQAPAARLYMGDIYENMLRGSLVHTSTVMVTRDRLDKVKFFDEELKSSGEDFDFHLRTCKWGRVGLIEIPSIRYQKGRADHLSLDSYSNAINFLRTVQHAVLDEAGSGRFKERLVQQVLAEAHGWVAEESFRRRDGSSVRRHAYQSLKRKPLQPRLTLLFAVACLPHWARRSLLDTYQGLKRRCMTGTPHSGDAVSNPDTHVPRARIVQG